MDINCDAGGGLATDIGATFEEWEASAAQTIAAGARVPQTNLDTRTEAEGGGRFTVSAGGTITINQAGFVVVDYSIGIERVNATQVSEFRCFVKVNNTDAGWDGKHMPNPVPAGVNGVLAPTGEAETFHPSFVGWVNIGDVINCEVETFGGSVRILGNNGIQGPGTYLTVAHLGPGIAPYNGSVWA